MDDAPDWLNEAAADVGVQPVQPTAGGAGAGAAGALAASSALSAAADMAASLPAAPIVEVVVPAEEGAAEGGYPPAGEAGAQLVRTTLEAAAALTAHSELRYTLHTPSTIVQRPPACLTADFFAQACLAVHGLFVAASEGGGGDAEGGGGGGGYMGAGKPLLPPPADTNMTWPSSYTAVGRLLGFAAVHGLRVPLPLHASAFFHLTRTPLVAGAPSDDPPRSDGTAAAAAGAAAAAAAGAAAAGWGVGAGGSAAALNRALALLGGYDAPSAFAIRCDVSKRQAPPATSGAPSAAALAAGPASPLPKYARAIGDVQQRLLLSRTPALDAMRNGLVEIVGAEALAALGPSGLCARLLGWEALRPQLPPRAASGGGGSLCERLAFEFDAWDDDELRDAYEGWFVSWTLGLAPVPRCAFLLLTFGAAVGPPLARTTLLLPSAGHCATFLPEAAQIMLPAASSADEFAQRMDASIVLGAAPPPSNLSSEM